MKKIPKEIIITVVMIIADVLTTIFGKKSKKSAR